MARSGSRASRSKFRSVLSESGGNGREKLDGGREKPGIFRLQIRGERALLHGRSYRKGRSGYPTVLSSQLKSVLERGLARTVGTSPDSKRSERGRNPTVREGSAIMSPC